MDASDAPLLPVVLRLQEALNVINGMVTENRTSRDAAQSLPAHRQEQENLRLARELEQIGVLCGIVQGLIAATLQAIRDNDYQAVALRLQEANDIAKRMSEVCRVRLDAASHLPPEGREEETRRFEGNLGFLHVLVKILDDIADGILEGITAKTTVPNREA
jgi:hypothetical protein